MLMTGTAHADRRLGGPVPLRPARPTIATLRVTTLSGFPDYVSLSASLTALRPIELDVGANWYQFPPVGHGTGFYARAGMAKRPKDTREATGRGSTQTLTVMAGYRYLEVENVWKERFPNHGAGLNLGLEEINWFGPHFGISAQLVLGLDYWLFPAGILRRYPITPDVRITAGVAF
jgi:hypothetical protein